MSSPLLDKELLRLCKHTVLRIGHSEGFDIRGGHFTLCLKSKVGQSAAQVDRQLLGKIRQGSGELSMRFHLVVHRPCVTAPISVLPK